MQKSNKLESAEERYEFKKTARHDITESKFDDSWDETGRYLAIFGTKRSPIDKSDKTLKIFNIFGELLMQYEKLQMLTQFKWRPRPKNILSTKEQAKLKQDFKTKYGKTFKDEEKTEKKKIGNVVKEEKQKVREEFLNKFFLPLR